MTQELSASIVKTTLSNQGYSIYKNRITEKELDSIRLELTIKPFTCPGYGNEEDVTPYKLYKENTSKIYVPYFYGITKFGKPETSKLNAPDSIDITFASNRPMRPYQQEIIKTYINSAKSIGGGIISVGCGRGKCLVKGTRIPLHNGKSKLVEDLLVGDELIGDDGKPIKILELGSGVSNMYTISEKLLDSRYNTNYISNFKPYTVNENHILTLLNNDNLVDIPILEYIALDEEQQKTYKWIKLPLQSLCSKKIMNIIINNKKTKKTDNDDSDDSDDDVFTFEPYDIGFSFSLTYKDANTIFQINKYLEMNKYNLCFLTDLYLGFLSGIFNAIYRSGDKSSLNFPFTLPILDSEPCYTTIVKLLNLLSITYKFVPYKTSFYLSLAKQKYIQIINNDYYTSIHKNIKVKPIGQLEYYGFELSGNGRFILQDRTITHNTVMGLKIAEELKVKTLILVHKEFLMNQWVERIKEYLPDARVGYIQGKTLDIQRKDIVLAMIQSLSDPRKDKDYPENLFESFGLVIADECHHLAARQFCRSLAKYPFKYTLGLSATPDRADGLARVFKHFLGDIVYKDSEIQQSAADIAMNHIPNSNVELYIYKMANSSIDPKYNKEELNYKKKPNIVTMKSNIANCEHRTRFLLSFLPRLIDEGRTILILSCRRTHITQMEKIINEMIISIPMPECSVGLYVGGMKQEKLDISATKRVIIATYEMAEEAFDCKTLNTLIFGTPHKNIKQAVGRILREEKAKRKFIPLIIDIQDIFSTLNGWNKIREKYYKTEGYPTKLYETLVKSKTCAPEVKFIKEVINTKKSNTTKTSKNTKDTKDTKNCIKGQNEDVCDVQDQDNDDNDDDNDKDNEQDKDNGNEDDDDEEKETIEFDF